MVEVALAAASASESWEKSLNDQTTAVTRTTCNGWYISSFSVQHKK